MVEGAYRAYDQNQMDYYPFGMMKQPEVKDSVVACDGYRPYNPGACGLAPMGYWAPNESCCQDINVNMVQLVLPAGRYRIRFGATLNSNQYIAIRNKQTDVDFFTYTNSGNISAIIELEQSITVQIRCDGDGQGDMQICNLNVEVYDPNYCATLATSNASGICPVLAEGFVDNGLEPIGWTFDEFRVKDICASGIQLDLKSGANAIRHLPTIIGATYQVQWKICDGKDGQITLTSSGVDTSFFATTFPIIASQTFVATDTLTNIRILGEADLAIDSLVVTKVCPRPPPSDRYRYAYNGKESLRSFGGRYDYGFRMYDEGIGRFLTVDPLWKQFPSLTPYQFSSNTPIQATDLDGAEGRLDLPSSDPNVQRMNKIQRQQYDKGVIYGAASGAALVGAVFAAPAVGSAAVSFGSRALLWSYSHPQTLTAAAAIFSGADLPTPGRGSAKIITRAAEELNEAAAANNLKPMWKTGTTVAEYVTTKNTEMVRLVSDLNASPAGGWLTTKNQIAGLNPDQLKALFALEKTPVGITNVIVPPGIKVSTGIAGEIKDWGKGGGFQLKLINPIPESSFSPSKPLGK